MKIKQAYITTTQKNKKVMGFKLDCAVKSYVEYKVLLFRLVQHNYIWIYQSFACGFSLVVN